MKLLNHAIACALFLAAIISSQVSNAQLDLPRGSQMATVTQTIGISEVSITYSRPSVNDREIWGALVPYGMNNLGFGTAETSPWRAGANENTTITFSHDARVEGQDIAAGTYGLHMVVHEDDGVTIIVSKNHTAWGSYFYNPADDVLRADVRAKAIPHVEQLRYVFNDVKADEATVALQWGQKEIPFRVGFDVNAIVMHDIRQKLENQPGFNRQTWEQAANFALTSGTDLEDGLKWIEAAIAGQFFSEENFNNINIKAGILQRLGRNAEAVQTLEAYMPKASVLEMHQIGRRFIAMDMAEEALKVFKKNAQQHPDTWPTDYGLARGYSAMGDYKKALEHILIAKERAPDQPNRNAIAVNVEKLKKGQDIN